jgi:cell division protein FtsB
LESDQVVLDIKSGFNQELYALNLTLKTINLAHVKFLKNIPRAAKNKYLLTITIFTIWMVFFDSQDIITTHFKLRKELNQLEESRNYYLRQIEATKTELGQLKSDPATLEKYAREKYYMKKDNEDLFIISE